MLIISEMAERIINSSVCFALKQKCSVIFCHCTWRAQAFPHRAVHVWTERRNIPPSYGQMICKVCFSAGYNKPTSRYESFDGWGLQVRMIVVTYRSHTLSTRESLILMRKQIVYERSWRTDHILYLCVDTFQYIHVVVTHIQDNVCICPVYVAVYFSIYAGQGGWFRFFWLLHVVLFSIVTSLV